MASLAVPSRDKFGKPRAAAMHCVFIRFLVPSGMRVAELQLFPLQR
jgi:hypothetical protein